ncbi:MAG: pyrroline-5-carboxylate reductase [Proteobacteria bacterium]|nr:pyrroline-5-carboxylate reductase [Pseudomonadota bacterium]
MAGEILLVGCGKMGGALLDGWLDQGTDGATISVVEPTPQASEPANRSDVHFYQSLYAVPSSFTPAIVLFAVKPQMMDEVAPAFASYTDAGATFLSIAAGKPIQFFAGHLGGGAAIVRAMPNTPASVRRGITVLCANAHVDAAARRSCEELLSSVGDVEWVEDEGLIDAVTAVSGSGPAYVFLLAECLAAAGVAAGLPKDLSDKLARVTVSGSGELLRLSPEDAATLRKNVTSPGGTTEAALGVLMDDDGLSKLMDEAVQAATDRSRDLAR